MSEGKVEKRNWHKISSYCLLAIAGIFVILWIIRPVDYTDYVLDHQIAFKQLTLSDQEIQDLLAGGNAGFESEESCFVFTKGNAVIIVSIEYYFVTYDKTSINASNSFTFNASESIYNVRSLGIGDNRQRLTPEILQRFKVDITRLAGE